MSWFNNYNNNAAQTSTNKTSIQKTPEKPDPRYEPEFISLGGGIYEGPDGKWYHENGDEVTE